LQSPFKFIPKVFNGVDVRALCRPVKFFHSDLHKPFLYGTSLCHAETGKVLPQTVVTKLEAQNSWESVVEKVSNCHTWVKVKIN
jgi:hypothetical protein